MQSCVLPSLPPVRPAMTFLDALGDLIGLTEPHLDEYDGAQFSTPSLIGHDDGKNDDE